jgi:hypothetical protein
LASYGSRVSQTRPSGGAVQRNRISDGALVDLSGLTLRELRDLSDPDDETCLARALSRVLAPTQADGHHGFQSKI